MYEIICQNCEKKHRASYAQKKYCSIKCRTEDWQKNNYNPFKNKTHTKETIQKIKNSEGYKNRKTRKGINHSEQVKQKMRKKRLKPAKEWNYKYRHDVKYKGPQRQKIIEWCNRNGGIPDEIATIWFKECQQCGWNKSKCDLHHRIHKKNGGSSELSNLMILCPNCHRLQHMSKL